MIRHLFLIFLLLCVNSTYALTDTIPSWLDTIPPVVKVIPKKKYHSTPFYIALKADENATIWVGVNSSQKMEEYKKHISVSKAGKTVIYFYAEDVYGNRSSLNTAVYILDFQPPKLTIKPDPGIFKSRVILRLNSNEPCRFYRHSDPTGRDTVPIGDTVVINKEFTGYISAVDMAGNITRSNELTYIVDTSSVNVTIHPPPGIYSRTLNLSFKASGEAKIYYTLDPLAPPKWFTPYFEPVKCPYGLTLVRYYARNKFGHESAILKATFAIDTVPPKVRYIHKKGETFDTLVLSTKEKSVIRYSLNKSATFEDSYKYNKPIVIPHKGKAFIKVLAKDRAGNISRRFVWEYKYDYTPPIIQPSHKSGTYNSTFILTFSASEPAKILYTLDGTSPSRTSPVYQDGITISKKGITKAGYIGIDEADNISQEEYLDFILDLSPPKVKTRIEGSIDKNNFLVALQASESARIYYEIGDKTPTISSPVYKEKIVMRTGQVLRYIAIDNAGNKSEVFVMRDLQRPMVSAIPGGGLFTSRVRIRFTKSMESDVYWRILPDSVFTLYKDSLVLREDGPHTLEYYSKSPEGFKSPIRRHQYMLDGTAPQVSITVGKGMKDSVSVFFECSENASIYYTVDGTSPRYSTTIQIAGNKFAMSKDRISILRSSEAKLAYYAEDVAGNQGAVSVLDIFKPRAIPNIPSGTDRVHNRILSLSLNTYDDRSQIYYEHHGKVPTRESPIYKEPITLLHSDTIKTFVVDASGYQGEVDMFIYLIDLPPSPQFVFFPDIVDIDEVVTFDVSGTLDHESTLKELTFLWDFDGDGTTDIKRRGEATVTHVFRKPGKYNTVLEVIDPMKRSAEVKHEVLVWGICPKNMVFVPREGDRSFCIDKYEWPNKKGKIPMVNVSWIRAKMYCFDEAKHLCSAEEWQYACSGGILTTTKGSHRVRYPYGSQYKTGLCPTEGEKIYKSGQFDDCKERFGTHDMIGNVWEWVADKQNGVPMIVGGTFKYKCKAHCGFSSKSSLITESKYTGFRCCK